MNELILLSLLFTKHFIVDFPLQKSYQWKNKGTYGHPGGLIHAWLHAICTYIIIYFIFKDAGLAWIIGIIDGFIHYHIDWAKMNINKRYNWGANTHEQFWILMGLDQYLHAMTYIGLVYLIFGV
jgi:hypothetical protein